MITPEAAQAAANERTGEMFAEVLSGAFDAEAEAVRQLHDTFCRAEEDLKIA